MAQDTIVLRVDERERPELVERLRAADLELRSVDHAHFGVRDDGVVATLYRSGKLVVQGRAAQLFVERFLPEHGATSAPAAPPGAADGPGLVTTIGSDEAGKGDYFGPLVVAAVEVRPEDRALLAKTGVTDSKQLSDQRVALLAPWIAEHHRHVIQRLDPPEYNREYAAHGNLNELLADLHARAIARLAAPGVRVVVDQFANEELLRTRLAETDVELIQIPRGERELAVAAASVLARNGFLEGLRAAGDEYAVDLHKGAGPPVDRCARELVRDHGRAALERVAKLHFKNTAKLDR